MAFDKKEYLKQYLKKYIKTPMGRAQHLLNSYNTEDKKYNRGKGDLTAQWIIGNIFSKPCAHCGKEGWEIIGCNRLDNSKPHTMDNVEPCCEKCNNKLYHDDIKKKVYQYTLDGRLVKVWNSIKEIMDDGTFNSFHVDTCCKGGRFDKRDNKWYTCHHHKGYKWSYTPL